MASLEETDLVAALEVFTGAAIQVDEMGDLALVEYRMGKAHRLNITLADLDQGEFKIVVVIGPLHLLQQRLGRRGGGQGGNADKEGGKKPNTNQLPHERILF